jgi:hypothetical protein
MEKDEKDMKITMKKFVVMKEASNEFERVDVGEPQKSRA